jgi:hypothetical protein
MERVIVSVEGQGRGRAREPRRAPASPPRGGRVKASVFLSEAAWERLVIHAAKERTSQSALVERLILEGLRRYVVSDRGERGPDAARGGEDRDGRAAGEGPPLRAIG